MDFFTAFTAFNVFMTVIYGLIFFYDLLWVTRIARFQRDQDGWVDDLGWILSGPVVAAILITGLWASNTIVILIGLALVFGARRGRRAAVQRAFAARQQREFDKAFAEFQESDGNPDSTSEPTDRQDTR